jgi:MtrB/PioB family decaheme-associated outer membrane protein
MKPSNSCNKALVLALRGAFLTMALLPAAKAADTSNPGQVGSPAAPVTGLDNSNPAIVELTRQQSRLELGLGYVSDDSYKFGEYNGLESQGGYLIGNIDLRGGGRYFDDDTTRWRAQGSNLGLDTRELSAEYGHQGRYRFTVDYDELRRNRSDSYQTPYLGVGSTTLTLPSNWVIPVLPRVNATTANARGLDFDASRSNAIVAGVSTPPTAAQLAVSDALMAADLPAFHHVDLDTKRQRTDLGYSRVLNDNWQFKAGYRHEDKNGLKPMGTITRQTGSDISTVLPDVIDQTTEQWDVGFSYTGEKAFLQVGYYGSLFDNNVNSLTWQNWAKSTAPNMNTMSSAPSNQFHQLTLSGGYDITPTAKLVVDAAYGRATQDEPFLMGDATVPVVPQSSADALVVSKAFNIKLTGRPASGLQLSAGYKFDERDNQTPVNTYQFSDANQPLSVLAPFPGGAVVAENANANQPYSKRVHKIEIGRAHV